MTQPIDAGTLVPAIAAERGIRLVAIASNRGFSARHLADKYRFESCTTDAASVIEHPEVDAVFAASDPTALGAMRAIENAGRRVGTDVAVVGFDDIPEAEVMNPPLTTVRQPKFRLGSAAMDAMLQLLRRERAESKRLPAELIVRASTAWAWTLTERGTG